MKSEETVIYCVFVECCEHPDNAFDDIPNTVWASYWSKGQAHRSATIMISQIVMLKTGEPLRYFDGEGPTPRRALRTLEGDPYRERIREACAACGRTLTLRDDTWDRISRRLENVKELWSIMPGTEDDPHGTTLEAYLPLPVLKQLAEKSARQDLGGLV